MSHELLHNAEVKVELCLSTQQAISQESTQLCFERLWGTLASYHPI